MENLAVGGATTQTLIADQLPRAEAVLRSGNVRLVTIDIGGNDFASLFGNPACVQDALAPGCPLTSVLDPVRERLDTIFTRLRQAGPGTPIAVMTYPNLFSGSGHPFEQPAENALSRMDGVIRDLAQQHGLLLVDPWDAFQGKSLQYTHVGDAKFDPHPNDAGHQVLADAFLPVLFP